MPFWPKGIYHPFALSWTICHPTANDPATYIHRRRHVLVDLDRPKGWACKRRRVLLTPMSGVPVLWWRVHFYATHEWMNGSASYSLPVPYQSVCALPTQLQSPNQTSMTERLAQGSCRIGIRELWFGWSPPSPVEQAYSPTAIISTQQCSLCGLACVAFGWRLVREVPRHKRPDRTPNLPVHCSPHNNFFTRCKCHGYHFPPPPPASCQDTSPFLAPRLEQLGSSCVISITSHCTILVL